MKTASRRILALVWTLSLATSAAAQTGQALGGLQWAPDYEGAKAAASESGKLVLLHFSTPSCQPCQLLETRVFNQPNVAGAIQQKFVPVKINANESPELAQSFGITQVPTDVIVTAEGKVVERFVSPATPMAYVGRMTEVATKFDSRSGASFQLAAAQAPYRNQAYGGAVNPSYANLQIPPAASKPAAPAPQQTANPYAAGGRYSQPESPATQPAPQTPAGSRYGQVTNQYAQATAPAEASPEADDSQEEHLAEASTPELPAGSPPLGFDGYCPVTMKRDWKWVQGDVKWGAIHRGRTYLFASQNAQQAFLENPDSFSPALSGVDPVLALETGESQPGQRKYALEYRGTFYMFAGEESLKKFWTNAEGYAQGVRQAMAGGNGTQIR